MGKEAGCSMKNILLTGDSKGLGKSIRQKLEENNFNIIGISRASSEIKYDLKNSEQIKELYFNEIKRLGPIYGFFVNNAAIAYDDIITNLNHNNLVDMYKINVFSPMLLTKYVLRDMILHKTKGSIVHISSISATLVIKD